MGDPFSNLRNSLAIDNNSESQDLVPKNTLTGISVLERADSGKGLGFKSNLIHPNSSKHLEKPKKKNYKYGKKSRQFKSHAKIPRAALHITSINLRPEEDLEVPDEGKDISHKRMQQNVIPRSSLTSNINTGGYTRTNGDSSPFTRDTKKHSLSFRAHEDNSLNNKWKNERKYESYINKNKPSDPSNIST